MRGWDFFMGHREHMGLVVMQFNAEYEDEKSARPDDYFQTFTVLIVAQKQLKSTENSISLFIILSEQNPHSTRNYIHVESFSLGGSKPTGIGYSDRDGGCHQSASPTILPGFLVPCGLLLSGGGEEFNY